MILIIIDSSHWAQKSGKKISSSSLQFPTAVGSLTCAARSTRYRHTFCHLSQRSFETMCTLYVLTESCERQPKWTELEVRQTPRKLDDPGRRTEPFYDWLLLLPRSSTRVYKFSYWPRNGTHLIVQELCESRGGRPGLSVLTSLLASVDVKIYWTMLRHWSQLVPNMSTTSEDIKLHFITIIRNGTPFPNRR